MPWDIVSSDFGGDETVNFGPRQESGSALYQIDTLATISSEEKNTAAPHIVSSVVGELACVSVDQHASIFNDCQHSITLGYDSVIEEMAISPDGCLLVLADSSGRLHVIDTENCNVIFSHVVAARCGDKTFSCIKCFTKSDDSYNLFVLMNSGELKILHSFNKETFTSGREEVMKTLKERLNSLNLSTVHSYVYDTVQLDKHFVTMGYGESILAVWEWNDGKPELVDEVKEDFIAASGIVQGKTTTDENFFFTLDSNNNLLLWNTQSWFLMRQWCDIKVRAFQLLETRDVQNHSLQDMRIALLTTPREGQCTLMIQSLPTFENIYNLQLNSPCFLSECLTLQDNLYVVECCSDEGFPDIVSTVRYRCLTETNPETRLYRILSKSKFEEALMFARLYNLEIKLVYKVKVNYLLEQLSPWNIKKHTEDKVKVMLEQLWECLRFVKDDLAQIEICMNCALPTVDLTQSLLSTCKQMLLEISEQKLTSTAKDKHHAILTKLNETKRRLMTYDLAFGSNQYSAEHWEHFRKTDLLQESLKYMRQGNLKVGLIIWVLHQEEWESEFKPVVIDSFFSYIPQEVKAPEILGVLRDSIIPHVVRLVPEKMESVVAWVLKKAIILELMEKTTWPMNALEFVQSIYKCLCKEVEIHYSEDICDHSDLVNRTKLYVSAILDPVKRLISNLKHLHDLHHKYKCYLTYAQFIEETTESVTFRMLDNVVALEMIQTRLNQQIRPYMKEHNLKEDQVFFKYIKDLLERSMGQTYYIEAPWESKVVAVTAYIKDSRLKCEAIMETMKMARIPLSAPIEKLIQEGMEIDHPKATDIREQYKMVTVRKLVLKYGVNRVPDKESSQNLIKYILLQDKPDCVQDALSVMEAYGNTEFQMEIYLFKCRDLINKNKLFECMELLRSCPEDLTTACCQHLIYFIQDSLRSPVVFDKSVCLPKKQHQCEAGVYLIKFLLNREKDYFTVQNLMSLLLILKNVHALLKEFSQYLTLEQYVDLEHRRETFVNYMKEFFKKKSRNYAKVHRLAEILQIPQVEVYGELTMQMIKKGNVKEAVILCRKLFCSDPSEKTAEIFHRVALVFQEILSEADSACLVDVKQLNLFEITHQLVSRALVMCSQTQLLNLIELSKLTYMNLSVVGQCEISTSSQESLLEGEDENIIVDKDWRVDNTFLDDALVMNSQMILPLTCKYAASCPVMSPPDSADGQPFTGMKNAVVSIIQHLKDNSHHQLAMQYTFHMIFTAMATNTNENRVDCADKSVCEENLQEISPVTAMYSQSQLYIRELVSAMLMKVFNCNDVNHDLALALLTCQPKNDVIKMMMGIINSSGHKYKKLKAIADVGIGIGQMYRMTQVIETCEKLKKNATWGHRLGKLKINFSDAFKNSDVEKRSLLPQLVQSEATSVSLIQDFCRAFRLDEDEALMLYLDRVFAMPQTASLLERSSRLEKAREAIREIKVKDNLMKKLLVMYNKTNSYDYETLSFLLMEMQRLEIYINELKAEKLLILLNYLKVYKRKSEPSKYELQFQPGEHRDDLQISDCLPSSSKTRLPFHSITSGDPWKIITAELTKDTVQTWLDMAGLLKLDHDQLYMMTVRNMVQHHVSVVKRTSQNTGGSTVDKTQWNWEVKEANQELLSDVQKLLKLVSNYETALACAKWMVAELPIGAEKVLALRSCVTYADLWYNSAKENTSEKERARGAKTKFLNAYQRLATEQVLFVHKMGEPELVQLAGNLGKLIPKLFEHASITLTDPAIPKPDIHQVAEEIAAINGVDLVKLRLSLISKWLPSASAKQTDSESTVTFNFEHLKFAEQSIMHDSEDENENLKRVLYLLKRGSIEDNITHLLNIVFEDKSTGDVTAITNMCKIRALHCLLELRQDEMVQKMCGRPVSELRNLLKTTSYLIALEKLHILHSVESFESSNKEGLIKGIWRNHSHQKSASLLVASLSLDYKVHDLQIWNGVLQQLVHFNLHDQLEYVLIRLNAVPEMWQVPAFRTAWQAILVTPLTKVVAPLTDDQLDTCLHVFNMISRCPVLSETDIVTLMSKQFVKLELPLCAFSSLLLSNETQHMCEEMLNSLGTKLLDNSAKMVKHGMIASVVKKVEEALFCHILETEDFMSITTSAHSKAFYKYAVEHKNIDGILQFAVQHKKDLRLIFAVPCWVAQHENLVNSMVYARQMGNLIIGITEAAALLKMLCSQDTKLSGNLQCHMQDNKDDKVSMLKVCLELKGLHNSANLIQ